MTPEDVYELVGVSDPRVSPDGRMCAYVVTTIDREESKYLSAIWVVPTDGSAPARTFTFGTRRDSTPRWSPDGDRLAFVSNRDNEKAAQLYVIPVEGGEAVKLTDLKESVEEIVWSPDGTRIAFISRVRDTEYDEEDDRKRAPRRITGLLYKLESVGWTFDRRKQLFVVPSDGSTEPAQLTSGNFEHSSPAWSPDSRRIAFASARHRDWDISIASDIYVMGSRGGRPQRLTATDGGCGQPSWSPDGRHIAYTYNPGLFDLPRHTQIAVVSVETRRRRVLTASLDRNCAPFMVAREPIWVGNDVFFLVEDHGTNPIYRVSTSGRPDPQLVRRGPWTVVGYDVRAGVGVHVRSRATALPELFFKDKQLTHHGEAFTKSVGLAAPERFMATSADGSKVEAWIVRPDGFRAGRR